MFGFRDKDPAFKFFGFQIFLGPGFSRGSRIFELWGLELRFVVMGVDLGFQR